MKLVPSFLLFLIIFGFTQCKNDKQELFGKWVDTTGFIALEFTPDSLFISDAQSEYRQGYIYEWYAEDEIVYYSIVDPEISEGLKAFMHQIKIVKLTEKELEIFMEGTGSKMSLTKIINYKPNYPSAYQERKNRIIGTWASPASEDSSFYIYRFTKDSLFMHPSTKEIPFGKKYEWRNQNEIWAWHSIKNSDSVWVKINIEQIKVVHLAEDSLIMLSPSTETHWRMHRIKDTPQQ